MLDVLTGFVDELRQAGLPVSLTESLDAAEALHHIRLEDREALKCALGATLVKSSAHWRAFETAFEVYFSVRGLPFDLDAEGSAERASAEPADADGGWARDSGSEATLSDEEFAELLYRALLSANYAQLAALARQAVGRYAGMEQGRPVGGSYYLFRTLRNLGLDRLAERMVGALHLEAVGGGLTSLEERLVRDEIRSRLDQLRKEVEDEIRRRLVADRGTEALARSLRRPLPEDIDFMHATSDELAALRRAIQPLTRKLAVRLARKRRHGRKGALDFRSTVRHSLSTGGVPVEPRFRYPRPSKPEILVIADVSGSVSAFARFTLHLMYAMNSQFSRVRSFVFIDGIDEVTRFFEDADDVGEAVDRINTEADVVWVDGHSDYGHALSVFLDRWGEEVTSRTSVLLLGDGRNNYHASRAWILSEIRHKARHLYWLNPEPRAYWGSGDSIVGAYAAHCDRMYECRNLRQLEQFVTDLAS
jgi:hypothetical protein